MTRNGVGSFSDLPADRDLAFLHRLQHRALHFRRGAIDFIREQQVGEDGPLVDVKVAGLLVDDLRADDVGREHIDGELDALELEVDRLGDVIDEERLREAGQPLQQQMAAGEERDHHALDDDILADDDFGDALAHAGDELLRQSAHGRCGRGAEMEVRGWFGMQEILIW